MPTPPDADQLGPNPQPLLTPYQAAKLARQWRHDAPLSCLDNWWTTSDIPDEPGLIDQAGRLAAVAYPRRELTKNPPPPTRWLIAVRHPADAERASADPRAADVKQLELDNCEFHQALLYAQRIAETAGWQFAVPLPADTLSESNRPQNHRSPDPLCRPTTTNNT